MKYVDSPPAKGGQLRVSSPFPGSSILMTSAPMSPSVIEQNGPARTRVRSRTRIPARGWSARDTRLSFPDSLGEALGDRVHAVARAARAPPEEAGAVQRAEMGEVVDVVHRLDRDARADAPPARLPAVAAEPGDPPARDMRLHLPPLGAPRELPHALDDLREPRRRERVATRLEAARRVHR